MGGRHSTEENEQDDKIDSTSNNNKKKGNKSLRVSTDWRNDKKDQNEVPNIVDVDHLLRYSTTKVNYDPNPPQIIVEPIPVPCGYVFRNVLTVSTDSQLIILIQKMIKPQLFYYMIIL